MTLPTEEAVFPAAGVPPALDSPLLEQWDSKSSNTSASSSLQLLNLSPQYPARPIPLQPLDVGTEAGGACSSFQLGFHTDEGHLLMHVFTFMPFSEILNARVVCRAWDNVTVLRYQGGLPVWLAKKAVETRVGIEGPVAMPWCLMAVGGLPPAPLGESTAAVQVAPVGRVKYVCGRVHMSDVRAAGIEAGRVSPTDVASSSPNSFQSNSPTSRLQPNWTGSLPNIRMPSARVPVASARHVLLPTAPKPRRSAVAPFQWDEAAAPSVDEVATNTVHFGAVQLGRTVCIVGGRTRDERRTQCYSIELCHDSADQSSVRPLPDLPSPRTGHACCAVGNTVYVIGGYDGEHTTNECLCLEVSSPFDGWQPAPRYPAAVQRAAAVSFRGDLYVVGGQVVRGGDSGAEGVALRRLPLSQESEGSPLEWQLVQPSTQMQRPSTMRFPRYGHAAIVHQSRLYVIGGMCISTGVPLQSVEIFDFSARMWFDGPPLMKPRAGPSVAVFNGQLFVAGGFCAVAPLRSVEVLCEGSFIPRGSNVSSLMNSDAHFCLTNAVIAMREGCALVAND